MRTTWLICGLLAVSLLQISLLWLFSVPLGVPGEWVWPRLNPIVPVVGMIWPALLMGGLLTGYVFWNAGQMESATRRTRCLLLLGLWILGSGWILALIASTPGIAGLNRIPFVLYYTRSSGYFTQAEENRQQVAAFLEGYQARIADSSNPENHLHLGTHPPGLTLSLIGMLKACESIPGLTTLLTVTQPEGVRDSVITIQEMEAGSGRAVRLRDVEAAVLWGASLLTVLFAAGACFPLYLLARRSVPASAAWWGAAFWLLVPAIAVFVPKSDVLFAGVSMGAQCLWLLALDRNSLVTGWLTGLVMCVALTLSLAFAPVALMLLLQGIVTAVLLRTGTDGKSLLQERWKPATGAMAALGCWLGLAGLLGKMNLLEIWLQNLRNHAAFYDHNARTYGAWLLEIPVELGCSLGAPVALMALSGVIALLRKPDARSFELLIPVGVWTCLWLSGKNMGEAARLWVFLMPYLLWCATRTIQQWQSRPSGVSLLAAAFLLQMTVCVATAIRVDGFGFSELMK